MKVDYSSVAMENVVFGIGMKKVKQAMNVVALALSRLTLR